MSDQQHHTTQPDPNPPAVQPEVLLDDALPLERGACAELVDPQNTNSVVETGLVVAKEPRPEARFDPKVLWQAFLHGIKWPQLQRQLTKKALIGHTKRHGWKLAAAGMLFSMVQINVHPNTAPNQPAAANVLPYAAPPAASTPPTAPAPAVAGTGLALSESAKQSFVDRFASVAQGEMKKFELPASVVLALAIHQSQYGTSELAQRGNNYFNMGCDRNPLAEGVVDRVQQNQTCYVHYENAWTSFRAHSLDLQSGPYRSLRGNADLRQWASTLDQQGLIPAQTLLSIVARHDLHHYDTLEK